MPGQSAGGGGGGELVMLQLENVEKCFISPFSYPKRGWERAPGSVAGGPGVLGVPLPAGLAHHFSQGVGGDSPCGSSGIKQLQKAAGVTGSERMQIVY